MTEISLTKLYLFLTGQTGIYCYCEFIVARSDPINHQRACETKLSSMKDGWSFKAEFTVQ